ncbi:MULTISPECIES: hypothetical protein [unclassified Streptomyces]|uniref:hypothetical protein n=1 Tax=unclassified Streptomyces TaxID=2593676 RepID=UPI0003A11F61|nr:MULTISPECIES: hypothetical protein [unclassified Streptomyces]
MAEPAVAEALAASAHEDPDPGAAAPAGRPSRPLLAGAALLGAALVAVPVLLMSRQGEPERHDTTVANQAGTLLGGGAPTKEGPQAYASSSASPSKPAKPKKTPTPKQVAPKQAPVVAPVTPSPSPTKKPSPKPTPKKTPKPTPKPVKKPSRAADITVTATRVLRAGQSIEANRTRLRMQRDGNLVVYDENDKPRWATMTFGKNYQAVFQADGNLVVYTADSRPVWASKTQGHRGAILRLQKDGNLVIYSGGAPVWASKTQH